MSLTTKREIDLTDISHQFMAAVFNPDGTQVISADRMLNRTRLMNVVSGGPTSPLWKMSSGSLLPLFTAEGTRAVAIGSGLRAHLFSAWSGELLAEPLRIENRRFGDSSWKLSPTRDQMITSTKSREFQQWDLRDGRSLRKSIPGVRAGVRRMELSPDGTKLALAIFNTNELLLIDPTNQARVGETITHQKQISFARFSADGQKLLTAGEERTVRVWDAKTGQPISPPMDHPLPLKDVAISPDGSLVYTIDERTLRRWDGRTGKQLSEERPGFGIGTTQLSPDGKSILFTGQNVEVWDAATGARAFRIYGANSPCPAAFSPDGKLLAYATEAEGLFVYDTTSWQPVFAPGVASYRIVAIRFSPDGSQLYTGSDDGVVRIWNARTGQLESDLLAHNSPVSNIAVSPDGRLLAVGERDKLVSIWDRKGMLVAGALPTQSDKVEMAFNRDGTKLFLGGWDPPTALLLPPALPSAPAWLAELTELVSGLHESEAGELQPVSDFARFAELRSQLQSASGDEAYTRFARWFFADRLAREISPWGGGSTESELQTAMQANLRSGLRQALRYDPTNLALSVKLAWDLRGSDQEASRAEADFILGGATQAYVRQGVLAMREAKNEAYLKNTGARGLPKRSPACQPAELDLTMSYNALLDIPPFSAPNHFGPVPKGRITFGGTPFDVRAMVVIGRNRGENDKGFPSQVRGIPVEAKARKLHFLQTCGARPADGTKAAFYRLNYVNGESRELPVIYGEDLREWGSIGDTAAATKAQEVWRMRQGNRDMRLFKRTYDNPLPDVEIASIDLVSNLEECSPMILAITLE